MRGPGFITHPDFLMFTMDTNGACLSLLDESRVDASGELEAILRTALRLLGENPDRGGLLRTPARVAKSLGFLTSGYAEDPGETVNGAIFDEESDQMVIVRGVEFYSLCEHHLLPFFGKCHIAYLPLGKVIGLSKLARIVEIFARRLQVQERMTAQIARSIASLIPNQGVAVVTEAQHLCMKMRGVQSQCSDTVTSTFLGNFRTEQSARLEFLHFIQGR